MDVKEKIITALRQSLNGEYIRLEDEGEGRIAGFVVSRRFEGISSLNRQRLIDKTLDTAPNPLTTAERRRVLMIAGLTPVEHDSVGTRIRVHKVKEMAKDTLKVLLHGTPSDAEYVREVLNNQKGIHTTEPKSPPGAMGVLMSFQAKGTKAEPLTKAKVLHALKNDPYIEVMAAV